MTKIREFYFGLRQQLKATQRIASCYAVCKKIMNFAKNGI